MPVASLFVISFLFCEQYQERLEKKGNWCHPFDLFGHFLHFVFSSSFSWNSDPSHDSGFCFRFLFCQVDPGNDQIWHRGLKLHPFDHGEDTGYRFNLTYWEETKNMIKQDNNQKETGKSFLGLYCRGVPDPKIRIFHVGC